MIRNWWLGNFDFMLLFYYPRPSTTTNRPENMIVLYTRFLFGWFQPDDSIVDNQGRLPVKVNLPPTNELQQRFGRPSASPYLSALP